MVQQRSIGRAGELKGVAHLDSAGFRMDAQAEVGSQGKDKRQRRDAALEAFEEIDVSEDGPIPLFRRVPINPWMWANLDMKGTNVLYICNI